MTTNDAGFSSLQAVGDLDGAREDDIREDIIAPLLRRLGYARNSTNNLRRGVSLRYAKTFLGHKKPSDQRVLGIADYVLEVEKRIRWVIEAKAPSDAFTSDDVEQAFSYANHPEIRAVYFVLCNGRELVVYRTTDMPGSKPVLSISQVDLESKFFQIERVLGPDHVINDFPDLKIDFGVPLARGLASLAQVERGWWVNQGGSLNLPHLYGLNVSIVGGVIQRYEDGRMGIVLKTRAPHEGIDNVNKQLGLDQVVMVSPDKVISENKAQPTVFSMTQHVVFPAGLPMYDIVNAQYVVNPIDIACDVYAEAAGHWTGKVLEGSVRFAMDIPLLVEFHASVHGQFEIELQRVNSNRSIH